MRPSDQDLAKLLREAAAMIDRLAHKDIRKSFHEKNFAANDLRKTADALDASSEHRLDDDTLNAMVSAEHARQHPQDFPNAASHWARTVEEIARLLNVPESFRGEFDSGWNAHDVLAAVKHAADALAGAPREAPTTTEAELREALKPFAFFWAQWAKAPMNGLADTIYAIHGGTEFAAEIKRSDCQRAFIALAAPAAGENK